MKLLSISLQPKTPPPDIFSRTLMIVDELDGVPRPVGLNLLSVKKSLKNARKEGGVILANPSAAKTDYQKARESDLGFSSKSENKRGGDLIGRAKSSANVI
ncbi:hypothetical protein TNCV_4490691 [Trichonephila clavipes]|nr:hypothetical protein TNCV_4490691 [Trichonephila clavipes]